ncbi:MAG: glycoside hydrolase [Planctomycetota bacterium]|nr:MAG: glycoside hydrolase [Planctomycetota bacterium]
MTKTVYVIIACVLFCHGWLVASDAIDLSGKWTFSLDRNDTGEKECWFKKPLPEDDPARLPGSIQEQGYGDPPGPDTPWTGSIRYEEWDKAKYAPYRTADNFKMPFWLQPDRYYKGAAWFQKTVTIPPSWKDRHITLILERPHWETTVWVDSVAAGSENYLSVAHTYDISGLLSPGEHTLTIRVDNRVVVDVGIDSHSITEQTQSNWNGIVGSIKLKAEAPVWIEDIQVYPDLENNAAKVVTKLGNQSGNAQSGELVFDVYNGEKQVVTHQTKVIIASPGAVNEAIISFEGPAKTWDEFNPNLYTLKARLKIGQHTDEHVTTFGMRQIKLDGNRIMLNGRHVFMRGTLECCIFPKTGYPPTDVEAWKRIINICKTHGLNHIRFHSWCPPEAAFIAADELGFYYQVECSSWANHSSSIGNGKPIDAWLYHEADAILKAYGNHPSFLLFAYGNEPAGPEHGAVYLRKWVSHYKQKDTRRLITGASGWPQIDENDYHVTPKPRIQGWGQGLKSRINSQPPETTTDYSDYVRKYPNQAVISHEIGQWCVYPNFDEIKKYTGVLKPKNFEIFRDFLKQKHMLEQAHDFLMASGKLQTLCYKADIESALRTPNFGGFQLLDLHDFPGQGTALVGVLDPFWDSKPYVSAAEYKRFCGPVAPLAQLDRRIFTSSQTLSAQIDVSQFGPTDLTDVTVEWALLDKAGNAVKQGILTKDKLPAGDLYTIGNITIPLSDVSVPAKYTLQAEVTGTDSVNDWDIWVYPDTVETKAAEGIMVTRSLDRNTLEHLKKGGKVLLAIDPKHVKTDVQLGFSSIFWNTAWTRGQALQTLGILCDPKHPALAEFPTEYHSNWQWSEPIQNAAGMEMDHLPTELRPIVQVVPDWFDPKRLGLIFEAKVENGSILVCSIDILNNLENRPVLRQLRHSLLNYMDSEQFKPSIKVDIRSLKLSYFKSKAIRKEEKLARISQVNSCKNLKF